MEHVSQQVNVAMLGAQPVVIVLQVNTTVLAFWCIINKTGLQPVSRPVEQIVGAKKCSLLLKKH